MDVALRLELNHIIEIENKIFATNAPQRENAPYLVYFSNERPLKTLEGTTSYVEATYLLNTFSSSYSQLKELTTKVKDQIITFPLRVIGSNGVYVYVQDLTINNIEFGYENELSLHRSVIDFEVFYKEE